MGTSARRNVVSWVWILVGLLLIWRGLPYAGLRVNSDIVGLQGTCSWIALGIALVVGVGKGLTALRKGARRAVSHIVAQGEIGPWWYIFSLKMILLVGLMIAAGIAARLAPYDPVMKAWIVGILYPGVGVALLIGSRLVLTAEPLPAKG